MDEAISNSGRFVVGDYYGVDYMAQNYLKNKVPDDFVTVYHMMESPRNYVEGFNLKGGYLIDEERDYAMTKESHVDIAWSRSDSSGTARNLRRRGELDRLKWLEFLEVQISPEEIDKMRLKYEESILNTIKSYTPNQTEMNFMKLVNISKN